MFALYFLSAAVNAKRLIQTSDTEAKWMTEEEILGLIQNKMGFVDVTTFGFESFDRDKGVFPEKPSQSEIVSPLLLTIDKSKMTRFMSEFTSFPSRYYKSRNGKKASEWIFSQARRVARKSNVTITVSKFMHPWEQFR
jgi:leucyl aminopeptidase